mmetsp:Transcript_46416/g.77142  ORF Transcript_46416/g.77142 Transcript_46416/m.77142 type:complete len:668 (-) Transcript_46416:45-2048(-)
MLFASTVLVFLAVNCRAAFAPYEEWEVYFDHFTFLRPAEDYRLYWKILEDERVEIGLEVATTGWVGFGLSNDNTMGDSDIILGWIDESSDVPKPYLQRRHSVSIHERNPVFDEDLRDDLVEAWQEDGVTRIRFTRELFPCADEENPFVKQVVMGTSFVIFAYNNENPVCSGSDDVECLLVPHDAKSMGSQSIDFFSGKSSVVPMPEGVQQHDFLVENYTVPSKDTTYYCKFLQLDAPVNASHMIRFDPVVQAGNEAAVHHFILYWCKEFDVDKIGFSAECDDVANMPVFAGQSCRIDFEEILAVWAVGGSDFYFPEHVGFPIEGLQYVLLEIHYDNPNEIEGIVDSSGVRIYWTDELREQDAAMLTVGAPYDSTFIPGDMDVTVLNSFYGAPQCTLNSEIDPSQSVHAFAGLLHAHTIGTAIKFRHIRENVELRPLLQNEQYDFNYQQYVGLPQEVDIFPGDEFVCECYYKTNRVYPTYGGESTQDEMCACLVYYYPAWTATVVGGSKWTDQEYAEFFQTAIDNGWWNGTTSWSDNEANKTAYYYDGKNEDAVNHYLAFQARETRAIVCGAGGAPDDYIIPEARDEFIALPEDDFGDCNDNASQGADGDDSKALTGTEVVVISVVSAVVALSAIVVALIYCKRRQKTTGMQQYEHMDANEYGTTTTK